MTILSLSWKKWRAHLLIGQSPLQANSSPNMPSPHLTPLSLSPSNCWAHVTWVMAFLWFHHGPWWETEPLPHERLREGGKKGSYKVHADLQIEKVREREEEDSPLTKPCIQNTAPPQRKKKEKQQRITEKELIALLLYLLGFVANDFHIATSNALDALRGGVEENERGKKKSMGLSSCDLKNTNKQANKQMVSLKRVARSHKSTYLLCLLRGMKSRDNYRRLLPHTGLT